MLLLAPEVLLSGTGLGTSVEVKLAVTGAEVEAKLVMFRRWIDPAQMLAEAGLTTV